MSATATAGARLLRWEARAPRRLLRRRVTLAYELAIVVAWVALAVHLLSDPGEHHASGPHAMTAPHHVAMWAAMSAAMMLPAALPALAHVGVNSLRRRRRRAMALFAAVYLGIWLAFGGLVLALSPLWTRLDETLALAVVLTVAAAWQLTRWKLVALRACHRAVPLPPYGRRADAAVVRFGVRNGSACVGSCWAMMLAMGVASGGAMLPAMVALTPLVTIEKLADRPRRTTRLVALALAVAAGVAVVLV
jgi:predicted metal-binding membrane protein